MKRNQGIPKSFMKRKFSCIWLALALALIAPLARAQYAFGPVDSDGNFNPDGTFSYLCPPQDPSQDATNFVVNNSFTIDFNSLSVNNELYETYDTVNYTNNGTLMANTGFKFDTQPSSGAANAMAGTFYNAGTVYSDSITNLSGSLIDGIGVINELFFGGAGTTEIWATNVVNSGLVDVGDDGFIQVTANNADFTGGQLNVEGLFTENFLGTVLGTVNIQSTGAVGTDTNKEWNPGNDLTATEALSSFCPFPTQLLLTNSTAYLSSVQTAPSNVVHRAVFIQNTSPNAPYQVYIDDPNASSLGFEAGAAHVEWDGFYVDPATGNSITNFLYLTDDYGLGASTNAAVNNGLPNNFTFLTSSTRLFANPIIAGFDPTVFPVGTITNPFAYMNGQLLGTTVSTNVSITNPHGALTNLVGRIQITASNELNLAGVSISGPNYLSLVAPHQFDGSPGASISAPYSDINLGVTNGFLAITNLLMANIPQWSGTIQAWSTRWVAVDATGVTNDYRVLLVASQLQPTTAPAIQNLRLHATNSLIISDVLNVLGTINMDAQNITLSTNLIGVGATSLDGELNWNNSATFGATQVPNLRWLTNNGAIRLANNAVFGSAAITYGAFINSSLISDGGTALWTTNFLNAGIITNGTGSFNLQAQVALATNGSISAGSDLIMGGGSLVLSNETLSAGRMLQLQFTNLLTDSGITTNNMIWTVGASGISGVDGGFDLPFKPALGDLLGTTVTNIAPVSKKINNVWAGQDLGVSNNGFTNNVAVGHLVLNALANNSSFYYTGAGVSNAIYVDRLDFVGAAAGGATNSYDFTPWLGINTNMVIYFAQATVNGISVSEQINEASRYFGKNGGRLLWVPSYAGYFSGTNLVYPDDTTNVVNAALASSSDIDSDGDGTVNASDPTPVFLSNQVNFTLRTTNTPPLTAVLSWYSIPSATNYIYYKTNLTSSSWQMLTNFVSPSAVPPAGGWPISTVIQDPISGSGRYYKVSVNPNTTDAYGF
jgi:hypothetical protein